MDWRADLTFVLECFKSLSHSQATEAKLDMAEKVVALTARMPEIESWPEVKALVDSAKNYAKIAGGEVVTHPDTGHVTGWTLPPAAGYAGGRGGSMWSGPDAIKVGQ